MNARALRILVASQNFKRHPISSFTTLLILTLCINPAHATVITCTNNGDWSVAATWSPELVPGSGDEVFITNYNVTLDISTSVAGLTLSAGSLGGSGSLTVNGPFLWSGGNIDSPSGVTLNGTSSIDVTGGNSVELTGRLINAGA